MHLLKTVLNYQYDFWRTEDGLGPIQMNLPEMDQFLQLSRFQPALVYMGDPKNGGGTYLLPKAAPYSTPPPSRCFWHLP